MRGRLVRHRRDSICGNTSVVMVGLVVGVAVAVTVTTGLSSLFLLWSSKALATTTRGY